MRNSQTYWKRVCYTSILLVTTVCNVELALGQETVAQQDVVQPKGGFIWQSESESFRMYDGKNHPYNDIIDSMNAEGLGMYFDDNNKSYPLIKLGQWPWIFKPDGTLTSMSRLRHACAEFYFFCIWKPFS